MRGQSQRTSRPYCSVNIRVKPAVTGSASLPRKLGASTGQHAALVGTEVKVDDIEGSLDLAPEIHAAVDMVIVSVHRFPDGSGGLRDFRDISAEEAEETEFALSLAALDNPDTDILGHPFGMTLRRYRREPREDHWQALIEKCASKNIAFDISGRYHPNPWQLINWCSEKTRQSFWDSDAHAVEEVGRIQRILEGRESPWTFQRVVVTGAGSGVGNGIVSASLGKVAASHHRDGHIRLECGTVSVEREPNMAES